MSHSPTPQQFADQVCRRLLDQGWVPAPLQAPGVLRCMVGSGAQVFFVDAASWDRLTLRDPLFKTPPLVGCPHRVVVYLSAGDRQADRKAVATAARRKFLGGVEALALVELESRLLTFSKPRGWIGAFHPNPLLTALRQALEAPEEGVDFEAAVQQTAHTVQEFSGWMAEVRPLWTPVFLVACTLLTLLAEVSGGSTDSFTMFRLGALWRPAVLGNGEWWRLATCTLLHFGWIHLLVNMYSLYAVGEVLERILGRGRYLFLLVISGLGGALASLWGHPHTLSAGLSGAIFGLAASTCVLGYAGRLPIPRIARRALIDGLAPAVVYNLLYGLTSSGVDNYAHLGGLFSGALITWMMFPRRSAELKRHSLPAVLGLVAVGYALAVLLGLVSYLRRPLPMSRPWQSYEMSGTRISFGREFFLFNSEGVVRVYILPGTVLALGITAKAPWATPEAFLEQLKKELPNQPHEQVTLRGRQCVLTSGKSEQGQPTLTCRILDLGPDVVEVSLIGELVDGKRDRALLEAMLVEATGGPSRWGAP